jgi:hypothetical protein
MDFLSVESRELYRLSQKRILVILIVCSKSILMNNYHRSLVTAKFSRSTPCSLEVPMHTDSSLQWKDILLQALNESDRQKLRRLVPEAEVAIFLRRKELGNSVEAREELSTMAVAIEALRSIRVHQLGGGQPRPSNGSDRMPETA